MDDPERGVSPGIPPAQCPGGVRLTPSRPPRRRPDEHDGRGRTERAAANVESKAGPVGRCHIVFRLDLPEVRCAKGRGHTGSASGRRNSLTRRYRPHPPPTCCCADDEPGHLTRAVTCSCRRPSWRSGCRRCACPKCRDCRIRITNEIPPGGAWTRAFAHLPRGPHPRRPLRPMGRHVGDLAVKFLRRLQWSYASPGARHPRPPAGPGAMPLGPSSTSPDRGLHPREDE